MPAVFLSDLHLKSMDERNGQTLLRFFNSLIDAAEAPPAVFLLGDIFDLWVSGHAVFVERYRPLLDALARLRERGSRIVYFEGNHDLHLAPFWRDVLGAEVFVAPKTFEIDGLRVRCEHGDEINREDTAYLRLRAFLRHSVMEKLAHAVPGRVWDYVGRRLSAKSRGYSAAARLAREQDIVRHIRAHAERAYDEDTFDLIVSGHMHVQDDWSFRRGDREIRSINLGSWFEEQKVLVLDRGRLEWKSL